MRTPARLNAGRSCKGGLRMEHRLAPPRIRIRLALIAITGLGLATYGLLGGATKSALPLQAKNVSTVASDNFSVAIADTGIEPFPPGANGLQVVAMGPSHALYTYWLNGATATWYGPLQIGVPGSTYSAPDIADEEDGNLDVAVQGPNHTLDAYWFIQSNNTWYGPLQVGAAGSTYSHPRVAQDQKGNVDVVAQGPGGSIWFYWAIGGSWKGPLQVAGPGSSFSAPSMNTEGGSGCSSQACLGVGVLGPANQAVVYFEQGGTWLAPVYSGTNQEYSTPNTRSGTSSGPFWEEAYVGPAHALIWQQSDNRGGTNAYCIIGPAGTAYSASTSLAFEEAQSSSTSGGSLNLGVLGPSNSLYVFWSNFSGSTPNACGTSWYGPLQLSSAGTALSVPATYGHGDAAGKLVVDMVFEGPSNTLWDVYSSGGTWHGPIQIGGPGTTFGSNS